SESGVLLIFISFSCPLFPDHCLPSFEQLAILWPGLKRLPFDPFESEIATGVDGVDLLHPPPFHVYDIAFAEPLQFLIDLIPYSSLSLAWQVMITAPSLPGTERDRVELLPMIGNDLT